MKKILLIAGLFIILGSQAHAQNHLSVEAVDTHTESIADLVHFVLQKNSEGVSADDIIKELTTTKSEEAGTAIDPQKLQASVFSSGMFQSYAGGAPGFDAETNKDDILNLIDMDTTHVKSREIPIWVADPSEPGGGYWTTKTQWIEPCYIICIYEEDVTWNMSCQEWEDSWRDAQEEIDPGCPNKLSRSTGKPIGLQRNPKKIDPRIQINAERADSPTSGGFMNNINKFFNQLQILPR